MFRGQRGDLLGSAAPSSSSLKSKIYLFQTKMSSNVKGPSSAGDYGSVCETFRCHPPTNLRLSRTVKRILAACLVSLVTLLGSVSIDLNNCLKDWRSTEEALNGLSSCTNLLAMKFIGFLQDQKKLCCWDNLNFTDRRTLVMDNMRSFCGEEGGLQNYNRICENKAEMRHICELFTHRLKMRLHNVTDADPTLGDVFSGMITQILEEWNSSDGDLMTSIKKQDWMDVLSLRLLLRAREAMGDLCCLSPVASEDLQSASYRILTMLNYAVYTSDTLHACWMDNGNGSSLSGYLTKYRNVLLFAPLGDPRSTFGNLTADGRLDAVRSCLFHKAYEKLNNKSKDILGEVSLKVTLLAVTCVLYPIVLVSFKQMTEWIQDYAKSLKERTEDLKKERRVAEDLLHQMLPRTVAKQLRKQKRVEAESYDQVTIFFSDIVGFTAISASCTPLQVVGMLNSLYVCFDSRIESYNVYKVETIGDAYMVVSGLPERNNTRHADEIAKMSLDLVAAVRQVVIPHLPDERLRLRAGIHTGPCVAGVVGYKMPRYCLFGDTVNTASRMESTSLPQKIHISSATYQILLIDDAYEIELRGEIEVKGKGKMKTYWLLGNKNYSVQNDSLVCHWNPEISRKKKLELSMGSVQQSFSSIIPSETSRVNTPRILEELSGEESMEQSQELRVEDRAGDTTTEPKTPQSPTQQHRASTLRVPVSARAEGDIYNKLCQKAVALPGFVEES